MGLARPVQGLLSSCGIVVHRRQHVRFGAEPLLDLQRLLPEVSVIVDVGANEGQSALPFARTFPAARVFAFEPVPDTYAALATHTAQEPRIECFNFALGADERDATIRLSDSSRHNSLIHVAESGPGAVVVHVTTGDRWAAAHDIHEVDVLKVDTEGYELQVLAGFDGLIAAGKIKVVLAECEFARVTREPHTSFFSLYEHLTDRGMGLATLYTEALESNQFAWGNALFVAMRPPAARAQVVDDSGHPASLSNRQETSCR